MLMSFSRNDESVFQVGDLMWSDKNWLLVKWPKMWEFLTVYGRLF